MFFCEYWQPRLNHYNKIVYECVGTKEKENCDCNGYESNCPFYKEKRLKAEYAILNHNYVLEILRQE